MNEIALPNTFKLAVQPERVNLSTPQTFNWKEEGLSGESLRRMFLESKAPSTLDKDKDIANRPEVLAEKNVLRPYIEPERGFTIIDILDRIEAPNPETVRNIPEKELEDICAKNRELIGKAVEKLIDLIPRMGMSGLGEKALELLIENRRGTYGDNADGRGGEVISWGFMDEIEINKEMLISGLEKMALNAIRYASEREVGHIDQNPGGILIILPDRMNAVSKGRENLPIGEDRRGLHPENFDKLVVGIIGQERFIGLANVVIEIQESMNDAMYRRDDPEEYNRLYPYPALIRQLSSQSVIKDALNLLDLKSEKVE